VLVSVHDVMPETLDRVLALVTRLAHVRPAPLTLLVVPGRAWGGPELRALARLERAGHELAGHGWAHCSPAPRSLYHRLHAAFLSRRAAEHLALDVEAVVELMARCHRWFRQAGLGSPHLYVPPAWAMGAVPRARLAALPFRHYEGLGGVYDARRNRLRRLPLAGYQADSPGRVHGLRAWNALNIAWARASGQPLRVAVHPDDLDLPLAGELAGVLRSARDCRRYVALV